MALRADAHTGDPLCTIGSVESSSDTEGSVLSPADVSDKDVSAAAAAVVVVVVVAVVAPTGASDGPKRQSGAANMWNCVTVPLGDTGEETIGGACATLGDCGSKKKWPMGDGETPNAVDAVTVAVDAEARSDGAKNESLAVLSSAHAIGPGAAGEESGTSGAMLSPASGHHSDAYM